MNETELIPLDQILADDYFQPRDGGVKEGHVRLLMQTDPTAWPPLLVTPNDDGRFSLIDGFHRLEAARRLGLTTLPVRIDRDADYFSAVAANIAHGLPLSVPDRKAAARLMAEHEPNLSYREIGRRVSLNHETVKHALETEEVEPIERTKATPDPIRDLVRQVDRTYRSGEGRSVFGLGRSGNPKVFQREIECYAHEDQPEVAQALLAFGHACVAAAQPFLLGEG